MQQQQQQLADIAYLIVRATDRPSLTMLRPTPHHPDHRRDAVPNLSRCRKCASARTCVHGEQEGSA